MDQNTDHSGNVQVAMLTQLGMAQFEKLHGPVQEEGAAGMIVCRTCDMDWPCHRMGIMLITQALAMFQTMLPTGNMGALLQRFSGGR